MKFETLIGLRVVIRCANNLTFTGVVKELINKHGRTFLWIVTDEISSFGIVVPIDFIVETLIVPI